MKVFLRVMIQPNLAVSMIEMAHWPERDSKDFFFEEMCGPFLPKTERNKRELDALNSQFVAMQWRVFLDCVYRASLLAMSPLPVRKELAALWDRVEELEEYY